eukprot:IDg18199t1
MVPVENVSIQDALSELCDVAWPAEQAGTRRQEDTLLALLPASRTADGRRRIGEAKGAIANLVAMLEDPFIFHNDVGAVVVRLLRNLCARSPENQLRCAAADAHSRVLDCVERRLGGLNGSTVVRRVSIA